MGLHTGEPKVGEERYVGIGVHRAARIGAAGHGGQVLLSSTTKELAEEDLPPGVTIRDLGERRLKDIEQPQHLYQLVIDGLPDDFGQLRTLDVELARKRRRMYAGSALIGVLAAAVAIPVFALGQGGSGGGITVQGNAVAEIDPDRTRSSARCRTSVRGRARSPPAPARSGSPTSTTRPSLASIRALAASRGRPGVDTPTGLAASPGAVWVVGPNADQPVGDASGASIPQFDTVSGATSIGNVVPGGPGSVAARGTTVWVAPSSGLLSRLDPTERSRADGSIPNAGPAAVAVGAGAIWVADSEANTVTRVDATGLLTPIAVGHGPTAIAVGGGRRLGRRLARRRRRPHRPEHASRDDDDPGRAGPRRDRRRRRLGLGREQRRRHRHAHRSRRRKRRRRSGRRQPAGHRRRGRPRLGDRRPADDREPAGRAGRDGARRVGDGLDSMDPALAYDPESGSSSTPPARSSSTTRTSRLRGGSRLVPEVARVAADPLADGKTYTFTIRKGFRFSPPSDEPVTAQTFKYAIERSLSPTMKGPAQGFWATSSAPRRTWPARRRTSRASSRAETRCRSGSWRRLRTSSHGLRVPFFCAVPIGTPLDPKGVRKSSLRRPLLRRVLHARAGRRAEAQPELPREPPPSARPDRADRAASRQKSRRRSRPVPPTTPDRASTRTTPRGSPPATAREARRREGRQQYFVDPQLTRLRRPQHTPTSSSATCAPTGRQLRHRPQRAGRASERPGKGHEQPTDQYLPPEHARIQECPYLSAHAGPGRATTRRRRNRDRHPLHLQPSRVTSRPRSSRRTWRQSVSTVQSRGDSRPALSSDRLDRKKEPFDLAFGGPFGWVADYADPDEFLNPLLGSGDGRITFPAFDDPRYNTSARAPPFILYPSYLAYGRLDVDPARNGAPWLRSATGSNETSSPLVSAARSSSPFYGINSPHSASNTDLGPSGVLAR